MACDLYCCCLPQCEALHTCHSGFLIATPALGQAWFALLWSTPLQQFMAFEVKVALVEKLQDLTETDSSFLIVGIIIIVF